MLGEKKNPPKLTRRDLLHLSERKNVLFLERKS